MYRPTETDKAYLAGLVDGEGSIIIRHNHGNGNIQGLSLVVQVAMANTLVLEWAKSLYGGQVYTYRDKRNDSWKPITHWHISARQALSLLGDIYPYMRVKANEACVAIDFQITKSLRKTRHLTDDEALKETAQREMLKSLKSEESYA